MRAAAAGRETPRLIFDQPTMTTSPCRLLLLVVLLVVVLVLLLVLRPLLLVVLVLVLVLLLLLLLLPLRPLLLLLDYFCDVTGDNRSLNESHELVATD